MSAAETTNRPTVTTRAVLLLLGGAFATTVAGMVVSWAAVETSRTLDLAAPEAPSIAARVVWLQGANLALIAAAVALTAAALIVHFRRPRPLTHWVTICAWTRRIEWQGRWLTFEEYLAQRFDLRCTHGICEEEAAKLRRQNGLR